MKKFAQLVLLLSLVWLGWFIYSVERGTNPDAEITRMQQQAVKMAHSLDTPAQDWSAAIKAHKVGIGMTTKDVRASWGKPRQINKTVTDDTIREQWVYPGAYLYFENGVLTSAQEIGR